MLARSGLLKQATDLPLCILSMVLRKSIEILMVSYPFILTPPVVASYVWSSANGPRPRM